MVLMIVEGISSADADPTTGSAGAVLEGVEAQPPIAKIKTAKKHTIFIRKTPVVSNEYGAQRIRL
jgi:hypothetical protein